MLRFSLLGLTALIFALVWVFFGMKRLKEPEQIKPPVRTVIPERGDMEQILKISGHAESEFIVHVIPKVSGNIISLEADVGDAVKAGQVIALIDEAPNALQLQQAKAAFNAQKSTWERIESLFKAGSTTRQNYDEAKARYESAKSQYELALLQFNYTKVESPIDGVILLKHENVGALVSPQSGRPIFTIGDISRPVVKSAVPEKYYHFFTDPDKRPGMRITVPALEDKVFTGWIRTVSPYISPVNKTFEVVCDIDDKNTEIRPGMFVSAEFILEKRENILKIPIEALVSGSVLWIYDEDTGTVSSKQLSPLIKNGEYALLPDELEGSRIIIEGQHFIKEGQTVEIIDEREQSR